VKKFRLADFDGQLLQPEPDDEEGRNMHANALTLNLATVTGVQPNTAPTKSKKVNDGSLRPALHWPQIVDLLVDRTSRVARVEFKGDAPKDVYGRPMPRWFAPFRCSSLCETQKVFRMSDADGRTYAFRRCQIKRVILK